MESIPANGNPFQHDQFNMGTQIGANVHVMFGGFVDDRQSQMIVINTETGERIRITFGPGNNGKIVENQGMPASFEMMVGENTFADAKQWSEW